MSKVSFFTIKQLREFIIQSYFDWEAENADSLEVIYKPFSIEDGYFAGGCIRDVLRGRDPKDFDLLIPCNSEATEQSVYGSASSFMQWLYQDLNSLGYAPTLEIYHAYGQTSQNVDKFNDFNERLFMAGTITDVAGHSVDLLFSRYGNISDAVSTFDTTMNHLWLDERGHVRDKDCIMVDGTKYAAKMHTFVKPISDKRKAHMLERAKQLCLRHDDVVPNVLSCLMDFINC